VNPEGKGEASAPGRLAIAKLTGSVGCNMSSASLAPFRSRKFTLMWIGAMLSNIGTWMETVGVGILVTTATGKAGWTGLVAVFPNLFATHRMPDKIRPLNQGMPTRHRIMVVAVVTETAV